MTSIKVELHKGDLPDGLTLQGDIAVDSETTGLNYQRDRLCVIQLCDEAGATHLVQFSGKDYDAPNLKALLSDPSREFILHYARFDVAMVKQWLGVDMQKVFCTKIASKLVRTYTDRHGLKDLSRELAGIEMSKQQQSSDWASEELSEDQIHYAASDVIYLHELREKLTVMLEREGRMALARQCFAFMPTRVALDLAGWEEVDIFHH